ncbi:MAG: hypothetical protein ACLSVD_01265 [Eggerthellaceae bacterium]
MNRAHRQHQLRDAPAGALARCRRLALLRRIDPYETPTGTAPSCASRTSRDRRSSRCWNHARAGRHQATYPLKWATADTVEEVAGMVGLDGAKAKATVERYNGFCEAGKDEDCGTRRQDGAHDRPLLRSSIAVSTSVTVGGFKTNEQAQALRLPWLPAAR